MVLEKLKEIAGERNVKTNENMNVHCTFKTGGKAEIFIEPENAFQLSETIKILKEYGIPFAVIGNGSNILIGDKGIKGAVIHIGNYFSDIKIDGNLMEIGAGASLSQAAQAAAENCLKGFEFAAGIPGSFGGAVYMNAGAYGGEIKDIFCSACILSKNGEFTELNADDMEFGYRESAVSKNGHIMLSGKVKLEYGSKEEIRALMADFNQRRRDKQPLNFASAGSTFKRPEGHFAGKLIEDSGLKGYAVGGAMVSDKHAGFVVNTGNATTADILAVIGHCKKTVKEKFGVELETEIKFLGEQ